MRLQAADVRLVALARIDVHLNHILQHESRAIGCVVRRQGMGWRGGSTQLEPQSLDLPSQMESFEAASDWTENLDTGKT